MIFHNILTPFEFICQLHGFTNVCIVEHCTGYKHEKYNSIRTSVCASKFWSAVREDLFAQLRIVHFGDIRVAPIKRKGRKDSNQHEYRPPGSINRETINLIRPIKDARPEVSRRYSV